MAEAEGLELQSLARHWIENDYAALRQIQTARELHEAITSLMLAQMEVK